jgi:N-acetylmuramoyl-L-alanine amidase
MKNTLIMWVSLFTLMFITNLAYAQDSELQCLARNIFHEAGAESFDGKLAVGQVTINRTKHRAFPSTVCGVVKQKRQMTCQFSWYCSPEKPIDKKSKNWKDSVHVANLLLTYRMTYDKLGNDVLFFHTVSSPFDWNNHYHRVAVVGNHIFYKLKKRMNA